MGGLEWLEIFFKSQTQRTHTNTHVKSLSSVVIVYENNIYSIFKSVSFCNGIFIECKLHIETWKDAKDGKDSSCSFSR